MIKIKKIVLSIKIKLFKLLRKDVVDLKIKLFRLRGYIIGSNCRIFSDLGAPESYLVTIGNNVTISTNVTLLTHDNAIIKVSEKKYTDLFGRINIGDNCFIGANTILLPGITLAKGTIVAAGSVVTKSVTKSNMVIGGNPAKIICTTDDYMKKNEKYAFNCNGMNSETRRKNILSNEQKLLNKGEIK
jgi:acetyltransferase-like isoleucine patch superfamily enzyme